MEGSKRVVTGITALGAGLAVAVMSSSALGQKLDRVLYRRINRARGTGADTLFKAVTEAGSLWASGAAAATLAARGRKRAAIDALGAAVATWLLGQWLKKRFARPRPYQAVGGTRLLIAEPAGTSWPSSHPAVLRTFVRVAARHVGAGAPTTGALEGLAGLVGVSRVYLGVHYPSDVAGGLLIGRGVADLWSAVVSPHLGSSLCRGLPVQ